MRRWPLPLILVVVGCAKPAPTPPVSAPPANAPYRQVQLDATHRLWIYEPKGVTGKRPCILIAPAGAHMNDGMSLGEGDIDEEIPYVAAGYVVVAYDVSGPLEGNSGAAVVEATKAFAAADAGVADGKRALDYALKNLNVDPVHVAAAGHSSAATIALTLAENEPRIKACLAYAPVVDVAERLGDRLDALERAAPGVREKLVQFSPVTGKDSLRCPTLIFHAKDDDNVLSEPLTSFAHSIPSVTFHEVETGGHYDSMIREGIPAGIALLKKAGF